MAEGKDHLQAEHPNYRSGVPFDDSRRHQLVTALEEGIPVILGLGLPEWTPKQEEPPPAELVIAADTLRLVLLDRDIATRADPAGLTLRGAVVVDRVNLNDTTIGYPLTFHDCCFTDSVTLEGAKLHTVIFNGSHFAGEIRLLGAHINGQLSMRGASVGGTDNNGNSLVADNLRVVNAVALDSSHLCGALRLHTAHIGGRLNLGGATLDGTDNNSNSLVADNLWADGAVYMDQGFSAAGAIRLHTARIGGPLNLSGATLNGANRDGDSLVADGLRVDSVVLLDHGFTAAGAIRLVGAHISGSLNLSGATLTSANRDGDSLAADRLRADGSVLLDRGFTAVGEIRLLGAQIGGHLDLSGATLLGGADSDGDSLAADNLRVDSCVLLGGGFTAARAVRLVGAEIGNLVVGPDRTSLPRLGEVTGWRLRDMHGVIRTDRGAAAYWLDTQPAAQPWQELAAAYDRNGQPADARWMRYRSAVRSTRNTTGPSRWARQTYRWTTGHGYYPLAALAWLLVIFVLAWGLTAAWADEFTTGTTATIRADLTARAETATGTEDPPIPNPPIPGRAPAALCTDGWDVPCLNPPVHALTIAFPASGASQPWAPPDDNWLLTVVFHVLRLFAWVFAAFLLAGVIGLLRKQT